MREELFDELLQSVEEAGKIRRGELSPARSFNYDGHVLTEIQENGKTVWSIDDAAQEVNPNLLTQMDIQAIRESLNQTQKGFAELLGVSTGTLQGWEQGRRKPRGAAETLLYVAASNPRAVLNSVRKSGRSKKSEAARQ